MDVLEGENYRILEQLTAQVYGMFHHVSAGGTAFQTLSMPTCLHTAYWGPWKHCLHLWWPKNSLRPVQGLLLHNHQGVI